MSVEEKKIFDVTNEEGTIIDALQGNAVIKYQYEGDEEPTQVYAQAFTKGKVETEDGEFPEPEEGKVVMKMEIEVTPTNYPFYENREKKDMKLIEKEKLKKEGFALISNVKRTFEYRKETTQNLVENKRNSLVKVGGPLGGGEGEEAEEG